MKPTKRPLLIETKVTFTEVLECASQWGSIFGFILGIVTVVLAGTIKKAVTKAERKAVFNMLAGTNIEKLKCFNREFIQNISSNDRQVVRTGLSNLSTIIGIILRSAPNEFQSKGKKVIKKIQGQYNSYFYWEEKKWYYFLFQGTTKDDMMDTYNDVNSFIDQLNNFIAEKNIIR